MPDVHLGIGATIGSVIPTHGAVIPAAVGVDIGCGMMATRTSLTASQLPDNLFALRSCVERSVPHGRTDDGGRNDRGAWANAPKQIEDAWAGLSPGYEQIVAKNKVLKRGQTLGQLGTLGGGNHFIEVCLDEAQGLSHANLEALRLLSNLETEKSKLMQVVLFGQPELDVRLLRNDLRQMRQRIAFAYRLHGVSRCELGLYLEHRMRVAGHLGTAVFTPSAVAQLFRESEGTPRVVNVLAHKSLLAVFGEGGTAVERRHVRAAARDGVEPAPWRRWFGWSLR